MTCTCSKSTILWVSAFLVIIIIGSLTALAYTSSTAAIKSSVRTGLESTAGVMATQINGSEVVLFKAGDEGSLKYLAVIKKLRTLRSMDDHILNAYILKVNPDRSVTFLADDLYPDDPQGSAKIGELSTAPDSMEIFAALSRPTSSKDPYTTKYGSFMSAYAPIDDSVGDSNGNTQAVLAIDMSATDYTDYMSGKGYLILITGLISMILAVGAIFWFGSKRGDEKKDSGRQE
ncbi:MAG: hypothetical protein Q7V05_10235 [Methanoregula sp.]|nr:hypothetical protein [Methanoregula sp.]